MRIYLLIVIATMTFLFCINPSKTENSHVINEKPIYNGNLSIKKLFSIDLEIIDEYNISNYIWMDADKGNNLYVLDYFHQNMHLFKPNGEYDRIIINKGKKAHEINSSENFFVIENSLFIYDRFTGIKVFDFNGTLRKILQIDRPRNLGIFKPAGNFIIGLDVIIGGRNFEKGTWYLTKYNRIFKNLKIIEEINTDFFETPQFTLTFLLQS